MMPMRSVRITLFVLWLAGGAAGLGYASLKGIPAPVALPVLVAALLELSFYSALAFPALHRKMEAWGRLLPAMMVAAAAIPYCIYSLFTGVFAPAGLLAISLLAALAAWWFRVLPRSSITDVGFLLFMAGTYMVVGFRTFYADPWDGLRVDFLGQLMWIRIGIVALIVIRRFEGTGFGFWPDGREWRIGVKHFLYFLPLAVALAYGLDFARLSLAQDWWYKAPATFIGILWVVALAEELFFRGLLQQWLCRWLRPAAGVVATAILFGAAHLPFREFPNWKFALLAAVAGWFYGRAFIEGRGIRAAMVSHALVVTTWRTMFV
jgi:membrane protease YdiL (CAAX protease family)